MRVGMGHEGARREINMAFWQENLKEKVMIYDMIYSVNCNWVDTRWQ
jgi:hypothetical protein